MPRIHAEMTLEEYEATVAETIALVEKARIPTPEDKIRRDILLRFANLNGGIDTDAAMALLKSRAESAAAPEPEPVLAPVEKKSRKRAPRSPEEPYFYYPAKDLAFLDMWIDLGPSTNMPANLIIKGQPGSGKTSCIMEIGRRHDIPVHKLDCGSITTVERWLGRKELLNEEGVPVTRYILSDHLQWLQEDCILLYDEVTRVAPPLQNNLVPILDFSKRIWVPELGVTIDRNPRCRIAATANVGAGFTGTYRMDDAILSRFGYTLEQTFAPATEEQRILTSRLDIDEDDAKTLVAIAAETRIKANNGDLERPVSTRSLLDAAAAMSKGMSLVDAAEYTFVKMYSEEGGAKSERLLVRQIVQGKSKAK